MREEYCVEESKNKLGYIVAWLWGCWEDIGYYNDRCQEYEGKLGIVRDMGDTRLVISDAQRTVRLRAFTCSSVAEIVPSVD